MILWKIFFNLKHREVKVFMYNKIAKMCEERKISVSQLERNLHLGSGSIGKWTKSSPRVVTLKKIADYFNVDINYFLED